MQTRPTHYQTFFSTFDSEQFYKFFIDESDWHAGKFVFDDDISPGYLEHCTRALYYTLLTLDQPLTVELITGLHDLAYHDESNRKYFDLARTNCSAGVSLKQLSQKGLEALLDKIEKKTLPLKIIYLKHDVLDMYNTQSITHRYPFETLSSKQLAKLILNDLRKNTKDFIQIKRECSPLETYHCMQNMLAHYEQTIRHAKNKTEIYYALMQLLQDNHQLHPYADGNGRIINLLKLRELLRHDLSPSITIDSGKFSGHSVTELMELTKKEQKLFKLIRSKNSSQSMPFLDFLAEEISLPPILEKFYYFYIDVKKALMLYQADATFRSYIKKNLGLLYGGVISLPRNEHLIDQLLTTIPPKPKYLTMLFLRAIKNENIFLLNKITESLSAKTLKPLKADIFSNPFNYNWMMMPFILLQPGFKWSNREIISLLTFKNASPDHLFRLLIQHNHRSKYLLPIIKQLNPNYLLQLLKTDFSGVNGLQLICLYGQTDLITYVCSQIPTETQFTLMIHSIENADRPDKQQWQTKQLHHFCNMLMKEKFYELRHYQQTGYNITFFKSKSHNNTTPQLRMSFSSKYQQ